MAGDLKVLSPQDWLAARKELLAKEKEALRVSDELATQRRNLGVVEVKKDYTFTSPTTTNLTLADLFEGRKQLILYHFMLGPDANAGCVGCSFFADNLPHLSHLNSRETTFAAISRAPIEKIEAYKTRMGWKFPWYSSFGSDFNYDFHVTSDASVAPVEYNYKSEEELEDNPKLRVFAKGEQPGLSVFIARDGKVFHSYSTYARGVEKLHVTYQMLDLTPLGRQEDDPEHNLIADFKRHDEY